MESKKRCRLLRKVRTGGQWQMFDSGTFAQPSTTARKNAGYSFVELLVAMAFMAVIMGGMSYVFKSSINTFYSTGEKVSSARRNRLAMDLLYEDLNAAGMFITDFQNPPLGLKASNPLFYIYPNQTVTGFYVNGDQQYADQLYFYLDQPLPFIGKIASGSNYTYATEIAKDTSVAPVDTDKRWTIECGSETYANQAYDARKKGKLYMGFMDAWVTMNLAPITAPEKGSTAITVDWSREEETDGAEGVTGRVAGSPLKSMHNADSNVFFYIPRQMVRYSIQIVVMDPTSDVGIPCLVRDQGTYNSDSFVATYPQQVIAENVPGFKVFMSPNPGYLATVDSGAHTWAPWTTIGMGASGKTGWGTILDNFNEQLKSAGRPEVKVSGLESALVKNSKDPDGLTWFKTIPAVLRLDITTQTTSQRIEYSTTKTEAVKAQYTQSLVFAPRNFGLPLE